jgi:hypothetical protein
MTYNEYVLQVAAATKAANPTLPESNCRLQAEYLAREMKQHLERVQYEKTDRYNELNEKIKSLTMLVAELAKNINDENQKKALG